MTTEKMVKLFQQGSEDIFPAIWQAVKPRACRLALRYAQAAERNGGLDDEDLRQLAAIGVWTAAQNFSGQKDAKFTTWMCWHVRCHVRRALHLDRPCLDNAPTAALDAPIEGFDGEACLIDTVADEAATDPAEAAEMADIKRIVRAAVDRLPEKERDAVRLVYLEGKSQTQAAADLCLTYGAFQNRLKAGKDRLRRKLTPQCLWEAYEMALLRVPSSTYRVSNNAALASGLTSLDRIVISRERAEELRQQWITAKEKERETE